jgi:hypothetical protein
MCIIEPENYQEAFGDKAWQEAMKEELEVIEKNNTWELVERPIDKPREEQYLGIGGETD